MSAALVLVWLSGFAGGCAWMLQRITPPDRDPAQSEMRGADSPAGEDPHANSANSRELEKFA